MILQIGHDRQFTPVERPVANAVDALIGAGDVFRAAALVPEVESLRETPLRDAVLGYLAVVRGRSAEAGTRLRRAWDIVSAEREPETAANTGRPIDVRCYQPSSESVSSTPRAAGQSATARRFFPRACSPQMMAGELGVAWLARIRTTGCAAISSMPIRARWLDARAA